MVPRESVASMVENIIGCKWSVRMLQLCAEGRQRPSAILRACPGLSAKVMNERWRKLMRFGIVTRTVRGEKPPVEVEYQLTGFGGRFARILDEVRRLQETLDRSGHDLPEAGPDRPRPRVPAAARRRPALAIGPRRGAREP